MRYAGQTKSTQVKSLPVELKYNILLLLKLIVILHCVFEIEHHPKFCTGNYMYYIIYLHPIVDRVYFCEDITVLQRIWIVGLLRNTILSFRGSTFRSRYERSSHYYLTAIIHFPLAYQSPAYRLYILLRQWHPNLLLFSCRFSYFCVHSHIAQIQYKIFS